MCVLSHPSSETQGQSVGQGDKVRRKFSSKGGRAPGYRLLQDHFQTVKRMLAPNWAQKVLCIIVPNRRTVSPEFFHDGYYLATVARFVYQAFLTRNEGTTNESKHVSDTISRSSSICTEKILLYRK